MKVRLSAEVVSDEGALTRLYDILRFFETGRHQWVVDDIEAIERSKWVEQAGERQSARILELLRKAATEGAYGEATRSIELEIGIGADQTSPSSAWGMLGKPAYLVVENATSDGRFVRALCHAYDHPLLETALQEQWLEIDQAGGVGEIAKRVGTLIRERAADPRRIQALTDSDRLYPDHDSSTFRSMRALEQEHAITVHVLHKRDSENYLPLDAIAHHRHDSRRFRRAYDAFGQLSPVQQDHFDMKDGFATSTHGDVAPHPTQASIFAGVRQPVLRDLVGGFGRDCGRWFEEDGGVPSYIDRTTLEARCSTRPGELPAILARIEEML